MPFAKLYPLLVAKAERKGRTREEVDQVTTWLTGYTAGDIARLEQSTVCLLYTSPSPRDRTRSRMPSSA